MLHGEQSMKELRLLADDIRRVKWPEFLTDETAETICESYFSTVGSVAVDELVLQRIAEKHVGEVQSDELIYVTVFQVSQFSAVESFKLNDRIGFRPVSDVDIERFGYEVLPARRSPRLNKRDWICTVTQSFRVNDIAAAHRSR